MYTGERATPNGYTTMGGASNYVAMAPSIPSTRPADDDAVVTISDDLDEVHYLQPVSSNGGAPRRDGYGDDDDAGAPLLGGGVERRGDGRSGERGGAGDAEHPPTYSVCMADDKPGSSHC